jgi:hypothetical protein
MHMRSYTRRKLLSHALLAGAGATVVGSLAPEDAAADLKEAPGAPDPGFLAGQIATIKSNGLVTVIDEDGRPRAAQLGAQSLVWKRAAWGLDPLARGDCIYASGALAADGIFGVDQIWVGIENVYGIVRDRTPGLLLLDIGGRDVEIAVIARTETQTPSGGFAKGPAASPPIGAAVQVIGFHGGPGVFTASSVWLLDQNESLSAIEQTPITGSPAQVGPLILCPTTWKGLASYFCCGTNGNACGWNCTNAGPPWCTNQTCTSAGHYMAWKNIAQGSSRACNAACGNCCDSTLSQVQCGTTGHLYNPCQGKSDTAAIVDCGPNMSCLGTGFGCDNRKAIKFDLTPCSFVTLGGSLSAGHVTCDVTIYFQC